MLKNNDIKIGFWGGPEYSVITLEKLHSAGFNISFIVTSVDKPKGRNLVLTPPPAKVWGLEHGITVLQPASIKDGSFNPPECDVYIVMAYGKIIPENILNIPKAGSLNIHPSLLPKFRGSCPIESAILADDRDVGVTIMKMDGEMDHGPVVTQERVDIPWPPKAEELGKKLVEVGSELLVKILPDWIEGKIAVKEQDHTLATYTKKIQKEDGLIDLNGDPYQNYLKIQAYHGWPSAYFFVNEKRVKITEASFVAGELVIEKVIPEGKSEMRYTDFQ